MFRYDRRLNDNTEVKEVITNAWKHSGGSRLKIEYLTPGQLSQSGTKLSIETADA